MIKRSTTSTSNDQQRQWRTRGSPRAPHFVTATLCSALKYTNTNIEKRIYKHGNRQIQKLKNTNTNNEIQKCKRRQRRKFLEEVELDWKHVLIIHNVTARAFDDYNYFRWGEMLNVSSTRIDRIKRECHEKPWRLNHSHPTCKITVLVSAICSVFSILCIFTFCALACIALRCLPVSSLRAWGAHGRRAAGAHHCRPCATSATSTASEN